MPVGYPFRFSFLCVAAVVASVKALPVRALPPLTCMTQAQLHDTAKASRLTDENVVSLANSILCVSNRTVLNGDLVWSLLIVQNRQDPDRLLWYAPHTNESIAFDNAIAAVEKHHGTLVAVRTADGKRCQRTQDPNRLFGTLQGGGESCPESGPRCIPSERGQMPPFTGEVMSWHSPGAPVIGLHTNERGYNASTGCPHPNGRGNITAACSRGNLTTMPGAPPARGAWPDDTMVYVTATSSLLRALAQDPILKSVVEDLRQRHTNVLFERVIPTDCSLSNYAALHDIGRYFNIEVETSDAINQARVVDDLVEILQGHGVVPPARSGAR